MTVTDNCSGSVEVWLLTLAACNLSMEPLGDSFAKSDAHTLLRVTCPYDSVDINCYYLLYYSKMVGFRVDCEQKVVQQDDDLRVESEQKEVQTMNFREESEQRTKENN